MPSIGDLPHASSSGRWTASPFPNTVWDNRRQTEFDRGLIRMTPANNWAFSWVENPEAIDFFGKFVPIAKLPSRKRLSTRILDDALTDMRADSMKRAKGRDQLGYNNTLLTYFLSALHRLAL
jgi:hypothetical protein